MSTQERDNFITDVFEKENARRNKEYFRKDYNPIKGDPTQEVIPRFKITLWGDTLWLPESMRENNVVRLILNKRIAEVEEMSGDKDSFRQQIKTGLAMDRLSHDFEFWAASCARIQDKLSKKMIPFILNRGQRKLLARYEKQRLAGKPIRVILVKARQWGGSTLTQIYMLWLQLHHFENWHSAIISQLQPQAVNIRNMLSKVISNLPKYHPAASIKTFEQQQLIKHIPERGCRILVNSAENPDALRSFDFSMIHMSEVALWADTATKSGEDVAQSVYATVPDVPGSFVVMESTAKGIGTFFHRQWLAAQDNMVNKIDGLYPIFVAWYEIEIYKMKLPCSIAEFVKTLTEYERWQWSEGATLEGIYWYRTYKKKNNYSDFQMKSEFPTTADEAFQTKSGRYFSDELLTKIRSSCRPPVFIGEMRSKSLKGEGACEGIYLVENSGLMSEVLKIWTMPNDGIDTDTERVANRFVVSVDIGGRSFRSDNSVISVFDRFGMLIPGGPIERAAIWYGHLDPDILAWLAVKIAVFYNNALLVIENNTIDTKLKKESETYVNEGNHFYSVLDEISEVYDNLYMREGPADQITGKPTFKIGWHMNKSTKYQAYDSYTAQVRDNEYIERDNGAADEAQWLQLKPSGQIEAMSGQRDDKQDTTAVGVYIAREQMPNVRVYSITDGTSRPRPKRGGMASI